MQKRQRYRPFLPFLSLYMFFFGKNNEIKFCCLVFQHCGFGEFSIPPPVGNGNAPSVISFSLCSKLGRFQTDMVIFRVITKRGKDCYKTGHLLENFWMIIFSQRGKGKDCYETGQLFHYIMRQRLLQNGADITDQGNYYKMRHNESTLLLFTIVSLNLLA